MILEIFKSNLGTFANADLFAVGLAIAATAILGFLVFFNNARSITNKTFLAFSLVTVGWSVVNYFQYQAQPPILSFWVLRLVIFFGAWHAFTFFQLCYVFPRDQVDFSSFYKKGLVPLVVFTSLLTLTPAVFSRILEVSPEGKVLRVQNELGIALFGILVLILVLSGVFLLIRKTIRAKGAERTQFAFVSAGTFFTFLLLMIFNFILPAFFEAPQFIPLGALFILPFAGFTFYAILRHHLLNMKVVSTEILTLVLTIAVFFEAIFAQNILILIFRTGVFLLVLAFSILLIKSVRKEVEQREELERLAGDLKQANAKLEDLSRLKTQLLSLASHQIKSPLAAIKGFTEILIEGIYGQVNDKVKETLVKMKKSADGLVMLIDTLLNVRKVEEGRMDYQFARIDFRKLVEDTVEELRPLAGEKKLELTFTAPPEAAWVNADAQKLKQVVQNLIDNAIKYTPLGFVKVEVAPKESTYVLSVTDSGLGIPEELITHLFEEFIRDERVKKDILGTGLGLFIARKIVDAHSGKIWAESGGKDKGSRFYVALKKVA
ncbi:MAG: hypothetical protein A2946_01535 [Candidatus Liptonbacteria bacterium RIFCSPLOWO2_01_FULL_53_13]|uniref:histidine kinase n=1 Tax=Candidatus Liptonbacteria bacterium RIFCSPLOWO2_01_FULL_53_13 TaxID=1798651 RepID=A0A1G2CPB0_9BACT|nr:MAG: hypothetical protein A2946_01535 [Candidatus Liptonbacteria bacterium RIFCSPLOWO2_01_FULL_53_13]